MKTKNLSFKNVKIAVLGFLFVSIFVTNSCKKPTEGVDLVINEHVVGTTIGVAFVDANTGEPIEDKITLSIMGANASSVVDVSGADDASAITNAPAGGFAGLALKPDVIPTESSPVEFKIIASATGYLTTSAPVDIAVDGGHAVEVSMIKLTDLPAGISVSSDTVGINGNGTTTGSASFSSTDNKVRVHIPSGINVTNSSNTTVGLGNFTATLLNFNLDDDDAASAVPGGVTAEVNNQEIELLGCVSLEIRNGTEVNKNARKFSQPIQVTFELPDTKPDGSAYVIGEQVPMMSLEPEEGEWNEDGYAEVVASTTPGKKEVTFDVSHLSLVAPAFYYSKCSPAPYFKITKPQNGTNWLQGQSFYYELRRTSNSRLIKARTVTVRNNTIKFRLQGITGTTPNKSGKLKIWDEKGGELLLTVEHIGCGGDASMNISNNDPINIDVSAHCPLKPNFRLKPTMSIYYKKTGASGSYKFLGQMTDGLFTSSKIKVGQSYIFKTTFDGVRYQINYAFQTNEFVYDLELGEKTCNKLR